MSKRNRQVRVVRRVSILALSVILFQLHSVGQETGRAIAEEPRTYISLLDKCSNGGSDKQILILFHESFAELKSGLVDLIERSIKVPNLRWNCKAEVLNTAPLQDAFEEQVLSKKTPVLALIPGYVSNEIKGDNGILGALWFVGTRTAEPPLRIADGPAVHVDDPMLFDLVASDHIAQMPAPAAFLFPAITQECRIEGSEKPNKLAIRTFDSLCRFSSPQTVAVDSQGNWLPVRILSFQNYSWTTAESSSSLTHWHQATESMLELQLQAEILRLLDD